MSKLSQKPTLHMKGISNKQCNSRNNTAKTLNAVQSQTNLCDQQAGQNDDSLLYDLLAIVEKDDLKLPGPTSDKKVKENLRYSKSKVKISFKSSKSRGVSLPLRRTKQDLIKKFNEEKIASPAEKKQERKRKKSMIVITERFFNTKGSQYLIRDDKLTHDLCKRVSDASTADCRSGYQNSSKRATSQKYRKLTGFNPYEDQGSVTKGKRSNSSFLDDIGDTTPQKLDIHKSPNTQVSETNSYGLKMTPAKSGYVKRCSDSKKNIFKTPKLVIPKRKLSASKVSLCILLLKL